MKLVLFFVALLLAAQASAQTWTIGVPAEFNVIRYDQIFSYPVSSTGQTANKQDVRACSSVVLTLSDDTADVELYDCVAADTQQSDCNSVAVLPTAQGADSTEVSFPRGFVHFNVVSEGTGAGTIEAKCSGVLNQTYDGSAWVDTWTAGTCTAAP